MTKPSSKDSNLCWWLFAIVLAISILALGAYLDGDAPADPIVQISEEINVQQSELDAAMEVRREIARIARDAHDQGMREAIAASKGTPDGDALERSCAALWRQQQPQH